MRVKRGTISRRKHNKVMELTKGYRGTRNRLIRTAKTASLQAGQYAFHGRKLRKRDFRTLWITRIGEAVREENLSYSAFMRKVKKAQIVIDRKILAQLLATDPLAFKAIVKQAKTVN